jgi:6-phosphogluconate dehydrogenase (decarboxylating)
MQVGLAGLGRMGANRARRSRRHLRGEEGFGNRVLLAMRLVFGGHVALKKGER